MRYYNDLHDYQKEIIKLIINKKRCALWLSMGLGKTAITLTSLKSINKKTLIIAPLNVAKNVWHTEANEWEHLKGLKFSLILGALPQRVKALNANADIYIINRENIKWLVSYYIKKWDFDCVVIDESSSFKNPKSQRFKALKAVSFKAEYHIQLTGTPSPNSLLDIWSQIYLIDKGERLLKFITHYKSKYFNVDYMGYSYTPKNNALINITSRIKDIVIKKDLKDVEVSLPNTIYIDIPISLPKAIIKKYKEFKEERLLELENEDNIKALSVSGLINKLSQFSNGFVYNDDEIVDIHNEKIKALLDIIEDNPNENLLIAYKFKEDLERLKKIKGVEVFNNTYEQIKRWNDKEIKYLVAHPSSCAYGVNLQYGASIVVWYGMNYSLELTQQFNARLIRQNVNKTVRIINLICKNTIDEIINKQINDKKLNQKELLKLLK